MARPAKSIKVMKRHNTKEEIEKRETTENNLRGKDDAIVCPSWFGNRQKEIFDFIVENLKASNILSNLDIYVLTNCVTAIYNIEIYNIAFQQNPARLFDKDDVSNRDKFVKEFFRYCNELCLSPQARAKIGSLASQAKTENDDKLLQILMGGADEK